MKIHFLNLLFVKQLIQVTVTYFLALQPSVNKQNNIQKFSVFCIK